MPTLTSLPDGEPTARPFAIMPKSGHLVRIIDIYPPSMGGKRTVMHRTRTLDYLAGRSCTAISAITTQAVSQQARLLAPEQTQSTVRREVPGAY